MSSIAAAQYNAPKAIVAQDVFAAEFPQITPQSMVRTPHNDTAADDFRIRIRISVDFSRITKIVVHFGRKDNRPVFKFVTQNREKQLETAN